MIIQRNDPAFWEVRTLERRIRRGELTRKAVEEYLATLPDITEKATASKPLEEPLERMQPRRPAVRITAAPARSGAMLDGDDDLDDDDLLADDEDDDDDLADEGDDDDDDDGSLD
jgi:hypothetical protein